MAVSLLGTSAFAAEADTTATIKVASGTPDENGAVSLPVTIENNTGFAAFNLAVSYGDGLALESETWGELCPSELSEYHDVSDENVIYLSFADSADTTTLSGTLCTLSFTTTEAYDPDTGVEVSVAEGAPAGERLAGCFTDADQTAVSVAFVSGRVSGSAEDGGDYAWYYDNDTTDYIIRTAGELAALASLVNSGEDDFCDSTVTLANDIDLGAYSDWTPIGTIDYYFDGTFDGGGNTISGLTIVDVTGGCHGLFGCVSGTVKDFAVSGTIGSAASPITTALCDNIGGAVGFNAGTVSGVTANVGVYVNTSANDKAEQTYAVGGVVGQNNGTIVNCANLGDVTGSKRVGGIAGRSQGTITCCYNSGDITGNYGQKDGVGGIVGVAGDDSEPYENSVTYCYNTGAVSNPGGRWYGGIAGFAAQETTLTNCYTVGAIGSDGFNMDWNPVIGTLDSYDILDENGNKIASELDNYTVSDNYSLYGLSAGDSVTSATYAYTVGTVKTADELKAAAFLDDLNGGASNFKADSAVAPINGGYPVLYWQETVEPNGYVVTLDDRTGSAAPAAITGLTGGESYGGSVTFNVACDLACVVAYTTDGGETYTRLTATANANGGYDFTVNVTEAMEIAVVVKGDVNLSGSLNVTDAQILQRFIAETYTLGALNQCAGDVISPEGISVTDAQALQRAIAETYTIQW